MFMNLLYSFEVPGTAYKWFKKLTSFNNTTLKKGIQKALASWMFRILSLFDFQKVDCSKAPETLSQCFYEYIRYCWVWVKQLKNQFSIDDIASNHKFKKSLSSWILRESFSFVRAWVIDIFDMN